MEGDKVASHGGLVLRTAPDRPAILLGVDEEEDEGPFNLDENEDILQVRFLCLPYKPHADCMCTASMPRLPFLIHTHILNHSHNLAFPYGRPWRYIQLL